MKMTFNQLLEAYFCSRRQLPDGRVLPTNDSYLEQIVKLCDPNLLSRHCQDLGAEAFIITVRDKLLNVQRILKIARPDLSSTARDRFFRSAQILAGIQSDYFPSVIKVSKEPLYILLSWSPGVNLDTYVRSNVYSVAKGKYLFAKILQAVSILHKHGIIHRDLKPANIIVSPDEENIKVIDFGISKRDDESNNCTAIEYALGTPLYASPEQLQDAKNVGAPSDIFSLGRIFYFVCCREEKPFDPALLDIDDMLIFSKATNKDPEERFKTVDEFLSHIMPKHDKIPIKYDAFIKLLLIFKGNIQRMSIYTGLNIKDIYKFCNEIFMYLIK